MPFITTADAVDREAAWLNTTVADGLPLLPDTAGGKWQLINAYVPRTPAARKNQMWVLRPRMQIEREGFIRSIAHYRFQLHLMWMLSNGNGGAETDQRAFDAAIHDLVMRIRGVPPGVTAFNLNGQPDKTHDGKFMSAAENPSVVDVEMIEPLPYMTGASFAATVTYSADDFDFND